MIPYNLFQKVEEKGILPNLLYEASSIHILKADKKKKEKKGRKRQNKEGNGTLKCWYVKVSNKQKELYIINKSNLLQGAKTG